MTPLLTNSVESSTVLREERKHKPPAVAQDTIYKQAFQGMFTKLDPRLMVKNPVMFVVEIGFVLTLPMCIDPSFYGATVISQGYVIWVSVILFTTLLFANFAEA